MPILAITFMIALPMALMYFFFSSSGSALSPRSGAICSSVSNARYGLIASAPKPASVQN
jgi:hypothetical protein